MSDALFDLAKRYVDVIEAIEKTRSPTKLLLLEEKRADLHWEFMDMLKAHGIAFRDLDHATRIAIQIVRKGL